MNTCWFFFKWILLLGVICALTAVWYFRSTLDDEIRDHVRKTFADQYTDLDVNVQEARRVEGKGIQIRGLSLSQRDAGGPLSELAYLEEIFITCGTDLQELIRGQLDVTRVTIRRPTLRVTRRPDDTWSVEKLLPLPSFGDGAPVIDIEGATVVVFDPVKDPSATLTLRDINLTIRPSAVGANQDSAQRSHQFEGSLSGDFINRVELRGWYDKPSGRWSVRGRLDELSVSPELVASLPGSLSPKLRSLQAFRGQIGMRFNADSDPTRQPVRRFDVRGQILHGRIDDARLPFSLTDVSGAFKLNQDGAVVDEISARSGRSTFVLSGRQDGYAADSHLSISGSGKRIVLDPQMVAAMPPDWQQAWANYQPAGEVDAALQLDYTGHAWRPELVVTCRNVSFTNHRFPYRLDNGQGTITLKDNVLDIRLDAFAGSRPVKLDARVSNPGARGVGYLVAQTTHLPLDDRTYEALPPNTRQVIKSFAPQGTVNGYVRVTRDAPDAAWEHHCIVDLNQIAIRYAKFPYPIQNVTGRLEGVNRHWTFKNLSGTNDNGLVTAHGRSVPTAGGALVNLQIDGQLVHLDDELRGALSPSMQETWSRLRPRGRINVQSQLMYDSARRNLDLAVGIDFGQEGIVIEPDFFPYRMENLRGKVTYRDGHAEFAGLTATHGRTQIRSDGISRHRGDGSWEVRFTNLAVDHLRADRELLHALPARLRRSLTTLNFSGPLNMAGTMGFARAAGSEAPVRADWDLRLNTFQGRIDCGIQLEQIGGGVRLAGGFDGERFHSRGWLDIDSVLYNDLQFTEVQGPMWLGEDRVLFGAWAETPQPGQPPQRVTAQLYGGKLLGDCRIALADTTRFALGVQLTGGDLARFAAETLKGPTDLRGEVVANLQLQGSSRGVHTLNGKGAAQLRNGDIYQLPLVLSLLKILSIKSPDSKAFNTSDIQFRIDGSHVLFDEINFYGDALSLLGKGEMDFDRNIRMVYHAVVGNDRVKIPVLRPVLGLASQQLMLIYVHGTLDDPQTTREALPGVRRAVEGLQEGLEEPAADPSMLRKTKDWFDAVLPGG